MSLLMNIKMTALARYNANMEGEVEPEPIERLRFFLSLAITGQDWLDVEQFIDGVSNQLAIRDAEIAELKVVSDHNLATYHQAAELLRAEIATLRKQATLRLNALVKVRAFRGETPVLTYQGMEKIAEEALAATEPKEIPE